MNLKIKSKNNSMVKKVVWKCVGADITTNLNDVHPVMVVDNVFPYKTYVIKLEKAAVSRKENKFVNRKEKICMVIHHEVFDEEVYAVELWVTVTQEVPETDLFDSE